MERARLVLILICILALLGISAASYGQTSSSKLTPTPGYVRMPNVNINKVNPASNSIRFVLPAGKTSTRGLFLNDANSGGGGTNSGTGSKHGKTGSVPNLVGLNTVSTFTGAFASPAPSHRLPT